MSWAALARKAKDLPTPDGEAKQIVVAWTPDAPAATEGDDVETVVDASKPPVDLENLQRLTILDHLPAYNKGLLVLDTNAFIKGLDDYVSLADALVTTPQVMQEIKDRQARALVAKLPTQLIVIDPTPESIREVMDMAARTGDLGTLSRTDIRLCALALDCCQATHSRKDIIEPCAPSVNPRAVQDDANIKEVTEAVSDDEEEAKGGEETSEKVEGLDDAWGDDDGGSWITADNIKEVKAGSAAGGNIFDGGFACATSDYPMQNTLLHLGVPIVGPAGMRISELRLWLLRCHACFGIVTDTTRQFCPDCGSGNTLKRVNYVVQENGEKQLFINFKRVLSTRGTKYNLPKPRGGKNGTNRGLVLREDQLAHVIRGQKTALQVRQRNVEEDDDLAIFGDPVIRKKYDVSKPKEFSSYRRSNVNEHKKAKAATRK